MSTDLSHLTIMVDVDDVLFPLAPGLHAKAHEMGLHDNTVEALEVWHGWQQYQCEKQQWLDVFAALAEEGFYTSAKPYPGSVEALRLLHWHGATIRLVTARGFPFVDDEHDYSDDIRQWTYEWVEENAIPGTLHFFKDKVRAHHEIGPFDWAVDDGIHNFHALKGAGVPVLLQTQPHNAAEPVPAAERVNSLLEFAEIIAPGITQ